MKKAQVAGNMFVYMLAVIILGITFLFGTKLILSFKDTSESTIEIDFKRELGIVAEDIGSEWGSFKKERFPLPAKITHVCMANSDISADLAAINTGIDNAVGSGNLDNRLIENLIRDSIADQVNENVFMVKDKKEVYATFFIDDIKIWDYDMLKEPGGSIGFWCFENRNGLRLAFMGAGKFAKVAEDPS